MKNNKIVMIALFLLGFAAPPCMAQSGQFMNPVNFKLKNGINVVVAENTGTKKVYSSFTVDADSLTQLNPGLQEILYTLLNETALETQGGLSFKETGGNISTSIAGFEYALTSLKSTITETKFSQDAFNKCQSALIQSIKDKAKYYAEDVTEEAVGSLKLSDLNSLYHQYFAPTKCHLTIAGNISPAEAKVLVKKTFGDWTATTNRSSASR